MNPYRLARYLVALGAILSLCTGNRVVAVTTSDEAQENSAGQALAEACNTAAGPDALRQLGAQFDAFVARFPQSTGLHDLTLLYLDTLEKKDASLALGVANSYLQSPHDEIATVAQATVKRLRQAQEMRDCRARLAELGDIRFAAVDGREIDTANLRGKLVVIYLWDTTTEPMARNFPTLVECYRTYHDRGVEMLGISMDDAGDKVKWSEEQRVRMRENFKNQVLMRYLAESHVTWPQYYDGMGANNEVLRQYKVSPKALPMLLLLGKTGKVVALDVPAADLKQAIEKHLGD